MSTQWYRADIRKIRRDEWLTYIRETETFGGGTTKLFAQEEARRIIEETTGDKDFQVVWNEC